MSSDRFANPFRLAARVIITGALLAIVTGCGSRGSGSLASMPAAALPAYGIGDTYQFTDGSKETVVATAPDQVFWHDNEGSYITSRDVLLPRLAWTDSVVKGERR